MLKMLKACDQTQMEKLGFKFKKDHFYRLYGRCFQTFFFIPGRVDYYSFQVHAEMSYLSAGSGGGLLHEITGKREHGTFLFNRQSQEQTNEMLRGIFTMFESELIPIFDRVPDEASFLDVAETIAAQNVAALAKENASPAIPAHCERRWFCHCSRSYRMYAAAERYEEAIELLVQRIEKENLAGELSIERLIQLGDLEAAERARNHLESDMQRENRVLDMLRNDRDKYRSEEINMREQEAIDILWKKYRIKV